MRLKLLLAPILMVIIIVSIIWFVVPTYQDMSEKRTELKESNTKLSDLLEKSQKTEKLVGELQTKNAEQSQVLQYLPSSITDEQIIDNLNYIASADGISIYNLSVKHLTADMIAASGMTTASGAKKSNSSLEKTEVVYGLVGSYDKIKSVLQKIYTLKRYNAVKSISIKKVFLPGTENQDISTDNLQADVKLAFDYLEGMKTVDNINIPLLANGQFNMKAVTDLNSLTNIDVMKLNAPATGRANPFLP